MSALRPQAEHFDSVVADYDESIPLHVMAHLTRRRTALAEELAPRGGAVLDVGCGTGTFLRTLDPSRYRATGVDVSAGMLELARAHGLEVHHATGGELPFPDATFDLATTFAVLHHLVEPELVRATLREMSRVVKPGGAVLVWDHNPLNPYWPILMRRLPQDQGDEKLVPARMIVEALGSERMADIRLRRWTFMPEFTPPGAVRTVAALERVLERVPVLNLVAAHNVVTARRPSGD